MSQHDTSLLEKRRNYKPLSEVYAQPDSSRQAIDHGTLAAT